MGRLAKQRVALILQPGNYWVIEYAVNELEDSDVAEALRTCQLRGWAVPEANAIPHYLLGPNGELPDNPSGAAPVYRLTEAGWNAIKRTVGIHHFYNVLR